MLSLWSLRCGAKSGQLQDGLRGRLELRAAFSPSKRVTTDRSCGGWMASGRSRRCASPTTFLMRSRASKERSMKAIIYRQYGGPEVLEYAEVPAPKLSQNGVLIRVKAAALNPADHMLQAGLGDSIMDAWFPVIPGWDVAGVVGGVGG